MDLFEHVFEFTDISSSSFIQFSVWDFPGQIDFFDPTFDAETIFGGHCEALIYILDAQVTVILRKPHFTMPLPISNGFLFRTTTWNPSKSCTQSLVGLTRSIPTFTSRYSSTKLMGFPMTKRLRLSGIFISEQTTSFWMLGAIPSIWGALVLHIYGHKLQHSRSKHSIQNLFKILLSLLWLQFLLDQHLRSFHIRSFQ